MCSICGVSNTGRLPLVYHLLPRITTRLSPIATRLPPNTTDYHQLATDYHRLPRDTTTRLPKKLPHGYLALTAYLWTTHPKKWYQTTTRGLKSYHTTT